MKEGHKPDEGDTHDKDNNGSNLHSRGIIGVETQHVVAIASAEATAASGWGSSSPP